MIYLYSFIALVVLTIIYMSFEATWVEVKRVKFTPAKNSLKILQLSDIHIGKLRVNPEKVRKVIDNEKPDIVILSGDYIETRNQAYQFFEFLDHTLGNRKKDTYFCLGNHDYEVFLKDEAAQEKFISELQSRGLTPLHNASVCFEKNSKKYNIIGIADMRYHKQDIDKALKSRSGEAEVNIAFSHNPDICLSIPRGTVDYLFCGHFHGGQIWAPFNIEFALLRREKLCRMGVRRGLHKVNGINLYINRGLGNVVFPWRLFSRPEITIYHLS